MRTTTVVRTWIGMFLLGLSLAVPVAAEAPARVNYQGHLAENGLPVNGTRTMTFTFYNASSGGSVLGAPTGPADITVTNGLFNAVLGTAGIDWKSTNAWLEINVAGTTLSPREQINASIYALHAASATYAFAVPASGVTAGAFAAGAYTFPNMAVSGAQFSVGVSTLSIAAGMVGVGRTNPTEKLHVAGNIKADYGVVAGSGTFSAGLYPAQGGALPAGGYGEGSFFYNTTDHKLYVSTATVDDTADWVACW